MYSGKFYKDHAAEKNLELVFVSSDQGPGEFKEYFATMPFQALPFAKRTEAVALKAKFGVNGIPKLIILGPDGSVVCDDGRRALMNDPTGARFPWAR